MKHLYLINRILLGLVMLIPGLYKLGVMLGILQGDIPGMLAGFGFPAPVFFAWLLLLVEIAFGLAILANWNLKYTVWPPIVILVVAAFTAYLENIAQLLVHLALASNYLVWGMHGKKSMTGKSTKK